MNLYNGMVADTEMDQLGKKTENPEFALISCNIIPIVTMSDFLFFCRFLTDTGSSLVFVIICKLFFIFRILLYRNVF